MADDDFVPPRDLDDDALLWAEDFDPDTSPPGGVEAWLGDLPYELRDEYLVDPWTGAGEVMAAGFEHRAGRRSGPGGRGPDRPGAGRAGYGFAAGGVLDQLAPGPVLAGFVAEAMTGSSGGPGGCGAPGSSGSSGNSGGPGGAGTPDSAGPLDGAAASGGPCGAGDPDIPGTAGTSGTPDVPGSAGTSGNLEVSVGLAALGESELVGVLCASRRLASLAPRRRSRR